jgi:hypothetical protein
VSYCRLRVRDNLQIGVQHIVWGSYRRTREVPSVSAMKVLRSSPAGTGATGECHDETAFRLGHRLGNPRTAAGQFYVGTLTKFGVDLGVTSGGSMVWLVYAPTNRPAGALAGSYGGATAEASVVAGVGANVLVGGSNRTVELQPVSLQGQAGLNVAAGVAGIELRWVR